MKNKLYLVIWFVIISLTLNSCFVIMNKEKSVEVTKIILSPKPEVPMNEEPIRSEKGDMIAFLPKDWFLIDNANKISNDIFLIAVNPQYNISAVFSTLNVDDVQKLAIEKEGLTALAKISYENHKMNTDKQISIVGNYNIFEAGTLQFAVYNYTLNGKENAFSAVFYSQSGTYYEFTLLPMLVNQNPLPEQKEMEKYFRSILATIKY